MIKKSLILLVFLSSLAFGQNVSLLKSKFTLAKNYESAGKYEKAEQIYTELFKAQPWNTQYLQALNDVYLKQKKYDESVKLLKSAIAKQPANIEFYGLLGTTYYTKGDYEKAFEVWDKALTVSKSNPISYRIIANYALQNRAFDKAIEILKKGEEIFNGSTMFLYDLANLYSLTMNFAGATEEYCRILEKQPTQLNFVKNRIASYVQTNKAFEPTEKKIKEFYDATSNYVFLDLLASIYIQTKRFEEAFETVKKLDELTNAEGSKIFAFAEKVSREKEFEIAAKAYEFLFENFSDASFIPAAKLGYARNKEESLVAKVKQSNLLPEEKLQYLKFSKEFENIVLAYKEAAEKYNSPSTKSEAYYRIGKIYSDYLGNTAKALKCFEKVAKAFPYSTYAQYSILEIAKIKSCEGDFRSVEELINKGQFKRRASKVLKNQALFLLAETKYWQGKFHQALKLLSNLTKNLSSDKANDALELSITINLFKNDSLSLLKLAKADYFARCGKSDSAKPLFIGLSNNKNFVIKDIAQFKLAKLFVQTGKIPSAVSILDSLSKKKSLSLFADKALFLLANIYEYKIKNYKQAVTLYEKLLDNFPNSLYFDKSREKINSLNKIISNY